MDCSNELLLQENQMSLKDQQISDSMYIIQCHLLKKFCHSFESL